IAAACAGWRRASRSAPLSPGSPGRLRSTKPDSMTTSSAGCDHGRPRPDPDLDDLLPALRRAHAGNDARGRLPVVLHLPGLRTDAPPTGGRLLRLLFLG